MSIDPSSNRPKRRLALMPEVLPAPTRAAPSGLPNPRTRTIQRLKALAAVGAGLAACGKTTEDGVPIRQADAGPDAYGVVDPMPRPSCFSAEPTASARYLSGPRDAGADAEYPDYDAGPDGPRFVELVVTVNEPGVALGTITSTSQSIVEEEMTATGVRLVLQIQKDLDGTNITINASCSKGPSTISVQVTLTDTGVEADIRAY